MRVVPIVICLLVIGATSSALAQDQSDITPEQHKFFESEIRPLLVERCVKCHGAEKRENELRLDGRDGLLAGGDSGAVIVPGRPDESLLMEAVRYESFEMPPDAPLSDEQVATLEKWIEMGAPWPKDVALRAADRRITDEERAHWAYQPLREPEVPTVAEATWCRTEIDQFLARRLAEAGLGPAPEAPRVTLIRRLSFDLTGLPPTPEQIDAFLSDDSPGAYERLVDDLLESPRYGERWASFWLDLVRYADSDGYKADDYRPHAWRYRDYVVQSLNEDKPYYRFVMEQLAGDEIAPDDPAALAATGYYRNVIYEYNQRDAMGQWRDMLNDLTDNLADTFLAMGMGCARCHDHKFDPILQRDYYRLQSFVANVSFRDDVPLATPEQLRRFDEQQQEWQQATAEIRAELHEIEQPYRDRLSNSAVVKFAPEIQTIMSKPAEQRSAYELQIADLVQRQVDFEYAKLADQIKGEKKERWQALREELAKFDELKPDPLPPGTIVTDAAATPSPVMIPGRDGDVIEPGYPTLFDPAPADVAPIDDLDSSGRRTALAQWITQPDNPLTARVIVNRIWQQHFGTGLVATPSDFGQLGETPSHPELLDWLAVQFIADGWSLKALHRWIVNSAAYRQSAYAEDASVAERIDPANRLLWRFPVRRLSAEQIRDNVLAVSGELSLSPGGPSSDADKNRRSVYTKVLRNNRDPLLDAFDLPDRIAGTGERNITTTPSQSLLMINGEWSVDRASAFARRVNNDVPGGDDSKVRHAYRLAFGRDPSPVELERALEFLFDRRDAATDEYDDSPTQTASMPVTGSTAVFVHDGDQALPPRLDDVSDAPTGDFTLEATVLLESIYGDASVRTIVSHWDSDTKHPGWSLGVTSTKSRHTPRNLIMQLVGKSADGSLAYEVVPSGIHLELNRPYYVAVSVDVEQTGAEGVTFFVKDLSASETPLQTAQVAHRVVEGFRPDDAAVVIGGRDRASRHRWHGLIDDVRITAASLTETELSIRSGAASEQLFGWWVFDDEAGPLADRSPHARHLTPAGSRPTNRPDAALVDLCHVLLNANEFVYVD